MKQLFKTTLLAATIAATCGSAVAGNIAVTTQTHSLEGLKGVTANQTSSEIKYTVNAAYAVGDKVTFTFTDGALVTGGFDSEINVKSINNDDDTKSVAGMALGLLNSDANSVTYRVTSVNQPTNATDTSKEHKGRTTIGNSLSLKAVQYKSAAVEAGNVTVTVTSETSVGDVLDSAGTRTGTLAQAKSQFGGATATSKFNGIIDVSQARKQFTDGLVDAMGWEIKNPDTTGWLNLATVNATAGTVATLYGEAGKMTGLDINNWTVKGAKTFDEQAASLKVSYNGQVTNDTVTFTAVSGDKADILETQIFTTDLVYNYSSAGSVAGSKTIVTALASGEWKLNGATVNIPYMPYSPSASQIMYVSNAGMQAGDILVTAFDEKGEVYDLGKVGVAQGQKVTKLSGAIKTALEGKGFTAGKLSITITVNAPAADITVYASYNVGGADRGFVNTDQYKGVK